MPLGVCCGEKILEDRERMEEKSPIHDIYCKDQCRVRESQNEHLLRRGKGPGTPFRMIHYTTEFGIGSGWFPHSSSVMIPKDECKAQTG